MQKISFKSSVAAVSLFAVILLTFGDSWHFYIYHHKVCIHTLHIVPDDQTHYEKTNQPDYGKDCPLCNFIQHVEKNFLRQNNFTIHLVKTIDLSFSINLLFSSALVVYHISRAPPIF